MSADASATHALDEPRGSFTELDRFRLFVRRGVDQGKELTSIGERTTIGTHPSCDFVLSDPTVSRFHCEIVVTPSAIEVRDSNSLNGTRINGVSVLHAHAPPAAILQLGNTELSLEPRGDKLHLPL